MILYIDSEVCFFIRILLIFNKLFCYLLTTLSLQIFFFLITVSLFSSTVSLGIIFSLVTLFTAKAWLFSYLNVFTKPFYLGDTQTANTVSSVIGKEWSLYICFLVDSSKCVSQLPQLISSLATLHFHSVHIKPLRVLFLTEFHPSHFVQIREFPKAKLISPLVVSPSLKTKTHFAFAFGHCITPLTSSSFYFGQIL